MTQPPLTFPARPPQARWPAQRRGPFPRPWRIGFALAAVLSALLAACGGGDGAAPGDPDSSPSLKASHPGDLTIQVQRLLRERAASRQSGQTLGDMGRSVAPAPALGAAPAVAPAFSTSLTQEQGVDEPDLVKTDGTHLFTLDLQDGTRPQLRVTRRLVSGALEARAALPLARGTATSLSPRGLVITDDAKALAVASAGWEGFVGDPCVDICPATLIAPGPMWMRSLVSVERFDVSDPARPAATRRLEFDGRLVDARRVGDHLVLVSEYLPMLAADQVPVSATAGEREAAIAATRGTDVLPRVREAAGGTRALLSETDCWVQPANASLNLAVTTITVLDLKAADLAPASRCFVGGTEALYLTTQSLVLASTRWTYASGSALRYPPSMRTDIHKFSLAAGRIAYRGSGEVEGHLGWDPLRKSYRLSEHDGMLRVLSFTGTEGWAGAGDAGRLPPSPATLTVLRETAAGALAAIATLPNARQPQALGKPGEQVHGVRFAGSRGYLVTFRQIDPLYVLDLADAAEPRIAGVLEAPGFSDHLLPLPGQLLLGVGRDADANGRAGGVKVSLFDVADATKPRELGSRVFGAAGSQSGLDPSRQGLALFQQGNAMRVATPLFLFDAGFTNPRDGLQRLEVDLAARTLTSKPLLAPGGSQPAGNLATQRSVFIGEQLYWLYAGGLIRNDW